ncbi:MAG: hypothetical protein DMF76_25200 [Acidobacteria bacterium]|nr:MAG: hypothetical protein DMF76_25200 [Acidobacteriota bacterium]
MKWQADSEFAQLIEDQDFAGGTANILAQTKDKLVRVQEMSSSRIEFIRYLLPKFVHFLHYLIC